MTGLKNLRKYYNLTRKELGIKIGVSEATIAAYEQGTREPTIDNILKISDVLRVNITHLYGADNVDNDVYNLSDEEKAYILVRRIKNNLHKS